MLRMVAFPIDIIFIIRDFLVVNILFIAPIKFSCLFFRFLWQALKQTAKMPCVLCMPTPVWQFFSFIALILTKMVIEVMVWWCWSLCFIYFVNACSLLLIYPKTFCWIILCDERKLMLSYFYIPSPLKNMFTFFYLLKTRMVGWFIFLKQTTFS